MVTYFDFKEYIKEKAEIEIGGRVSVKKVRKLNGVTLDGLSIVTTDSNISPTIYLNGYYNEFKNLKESDEEALGIIWSSIKECYYQHLPKMLFDVEDFMCWDYVKDRLFVRLINTAINKELLEDLVSIPYLDLSIIFTVKVPAGEGTNGTINVKQEHMANWGVDSEELYEAAMANIKDDWNIVPMQDILFKIKDFKACENMFFPLNMYVVSNHDGMYGASVILNNDVIDEITDLAGDNSAYIIPSSVHELILIVGQDKDIDFYNMNYMIREVNQCGISRIDVLSDHYYVYNKEKSRLEYKFVDNETI